MGLFDKLFKRNSDRPGEVVPPENTSVLQPAPQPAAHDPSVDTRIPVQDYLAAVEANPANRDPLKFKQLLMAAYDPVKGPESALGLKLFKTDGKPIQNTRLFDASDLEGNLIPRGQVDDRITNKVISNGKRLVNEIASSGILLVQSQMVFPEGHAQVTTNITYDNKSPAITQIMNTESTRNELDKFIKENMNKNSWEINAAEFVRLVDGSYDPANGNKEKKVDMFRDRISDTSVLAPNVVSDRTLVKPLLSMAKN